MNKKRLSLVLILAVLSSTFLISMPIATAKYRRRKGGSTITFISAVPHAGGTKYTYEVESGSGRHRIKYWRLYSSAFRKYNVVDSSEPYSERGTRLHFPRSYGNGETRTVWFVLRHDYYSSPPMGTIVYRVKERYSYWGFVEGPKAPRR
jgi:hypothetical protein